jgi:hypothetical protein
MKGWCILADNKEPLSRCDPMAYAMWHEKMPEKSDWYIKKTGVGFQIAEDIVGDKRVSTVYLGLDHGFNGEVLLWETMIFPGCECWRYETYDEACLGHLDAIDHIHDEAENVL